MKYETKERVENFFETLINQIEENGLMQYDDDAEWLLNYAKEMLKLIKQEQKTDDDRVR